MGISLPARGVRRSNRGRSFDRRDVWVGPKPTKDYRRAVVIDTGLKNKTNKDTLPSERRSALKKTFDTDDVVRDVRLHDYMFAGQRVRPGGSARSSRIVVRGTRSAPTTLLNHTPRVAGFHNRVGVRI